MTREVLIGLLAVALGTAGLHTAYRREAARGVRFQLTYEDGGSLKAGDSIYMHGVDVGEVQDVNLDPDRKVRVSLKLADRFKSLVPAESQFLIASDKFLFGKKAIVVMPPSGAGTPVREGQVLKGVEGYTDLYMKTTTTKARRMWDSLRGWISSPEAKPADKPEEPHPEP